MTPAGITDVAADSACRTREPLRADAQHNREHILAIAREVLATSGDASLNSIAKKAGVGPGTLYRHFPSREALVLAVYQEDIQTLANAASELLAQHDPLQALRAWFDRLAAYGMSNHSLAGALQEATSDGLTYAAFEPITGAITLLVSACRQHGSIRPDVEPGDVLLLLGFLWRINPDPDAADRVTRMLDLVMTGLQAGAARAATGRRRPARRSLRLPRRLARRTQHGAFPPGLGR
jgi:AcrR family transcriptional regulator